MFRLADAREQKVLARPHSRRRELRHRYPTLLIQHGHDVERRQQQSHRDRPAAPHKHARIPPPDGHHRQQQHGNIRRGNRCRNVRQPNSCDRQRHRYKHLSCRTLAHNPQHQQRQERRGQHLCERAAHVNRQQHVRIHCIRDGDQTGVRFLEPLPRHKMHRQSGEKDHAHIERHRHEQPRNKAAQRAAQNPRQRRIKQEARFAAAEICIRRPARIENASVPLLRHFQPAVHVERQIVSARDAANRERCHHFASAAKISAHTVGVFTLEEGCGILFHANGVFLLLSVIPTEDFSPTEGSAVLRPGRIARRFSPQAQLNRFRSPLFKFRSFHACIHLFFIGASTVIDVLQLFR